jgi:K+-sensing histidine kinase KdpD
VLINLLENAAKYAGASAQIGVDATVETARFALTSGIPGRAFLPGRSWLF